MGRTHHHLSTDDFECLCQLSVIQSVVDEKKCADRKWYLSCLWRSNPPQHPYRKRTHSHQHWRPCWFWASLKSQPRPLTTDISRHSGYSVSRCARRKRTKAHCFTNMWHTWVRDDGNERLNDLEAVVKGHCSWYESQVDRCMKGKKDMSGRILSALSRGGGHRL